MPDWYDNDLLTDPQRVQMAQSELLPLAWDFTPVLEETEVVTSPVVVVTKVSPKPIEVVATAVSGAATIVGNVVTQSINGDPLTRGHLYEILVTATVASGKDVTLMTMLECIA